MSDLVPVEYGRRLLAEADTVQDVAKVIDYAEAAREAARRVKLTADEVRAYAVLSLDAQREAGRRLTAKGLRPGPKPIDDTLSSILGEPDRDKSLVRSSRWQRVAAIPEDSYRAYLDSIDGEDLGRGGLLRYAQHGTFTSSDSPEWYTPARYIEAARGVLGGIDLDPASCDAANEIVQADRYYTAKDNSLGREWSGRVFLNPPYGTSAAEGNSLFVPKLFAEYEAGRTTAAILLTSAHGTDTDWFSLLWDHTICFTDHRLGYWNENGIGAPTFGSAFTYLGLEPDRFAKRFGEFGAIIRRWIPNG